MRTNYLLDTTLLLHWVRNSAQAVETFFNLSTLPMRPLVCVVSIGEMLAFSGQLNWGAAKRQRLDELLNSNVVVVDVSDRRVLEAYADLSTLARQQGLSIFKGKNDLWVAAASLVTGSHLLTMDKDFLPMRGLYNGWHVTVFDAHTGIILP